jgi:C-terminal processing protease CtpA/Prc
MTHADGVRGWFGVKLDVDTTGFSLNPTLRSVTISKVIAGSPAASQGLASGDQVQEVEGLTVPGRKAREVQAVMHRSVGETLHLRLKRVNGDVYSVALTAVARP